MEQERNPEELAQYLDELFQSSDLPSPDQVDDPLAQVAMQLSNDTPPKLSVDMRARMLERVQQAHQPTTPVQPPKVSPKSVISFPAQALLRWVAGFAIVILLMNNVAVPAMADSLPGDILYPVKQTLESVELSLANSDENRAEVYIRQAERRMDEISRLGDTNPTHADLLTQALDNLSHANQLQSNNPVVQAQIDAISIHIVDQIENVAGSDPDTAEQLTQQIIDIVPDSVPTDEPEPQDAIQVAIPTETSTITPSMTATDIPTLTHTPLPTATDMPTLTHTPLPTATATQTPSPEPTATIEPTATFTFTPSPTFTDEPTLTPTYPAYIAVVSATANVNLRAQPTTDSEIVQRVAPGTIVTIIGEDADGQWLQVEIEGGQQGWIASSLIVEGTIPSFTLETAIDSEPTAVVPDTMVDPDQAVDATGNTTSGSSSESSNQGNDGTNKFGCDGQGNSCNAENNGNNGNSGGNNGNNNGGGNNGNNGNSGGNNGNGNGKNK